MTNQHTLIVGGSSGIGLATARLLLASGARVTITGRDPARLHAATQELGAGAEGVVMDAANAAALPATLERIGAIDHLVLALGSGRGVGPFATMSVTDVASGFEEKVYAHFATAQAALPHLSARGSITFVAAVSAHAALPGTSGIGAANAAVAGLVPILAVELKPRRVNGVSPGVIDTPWWSAVPEDQKRAIFAEYAGKTPVGRVGRAEDVAHAIAFLIGNDFMSGHTIVCDGGLRLSV